MIRIVDKSKCCGCTACYASCPYNAISMVEDRLGFKYPQVDMDKCVGCGICDRVCVYNAPSYSDLSPIKVYAARNRDESVRMGSSSGAVFPVAAANVLEHGGTPDRSGNVRPLSA